MIFTFNKWDIFCKKLKQKGITSIPAKEVDKEKNSFLVLKHDVETNVAKAHRLAKIEKKHGHSGSYYIQAYLINDDKNIKLLKEMQQMGHEISYHYDVMDSNKGNIEKAVAEFDKNKKLFEDNGFDMVTVCQHGNPLIERQGYTSNRDFFRNPEVSKRYNGITDIMVNFKERHGIDYKYYSDAGRCWNFIFDPCYNDLINSDDKNVMYKDLNDVLDSFEKDGKYIVSTHPHRWCSSAVIYALKNYCFKTVRFIAKIVYKIPFMKKFISKYYYLAKKI